ncbi:hypothetical protein CAPSP0001_0358 [Capnocytophaga sputigena ATCC 33612]|nr:hypothetical protein CAPSP0001_0358 [Capnocytophaga sputigena ATCC 33612]
MRKYTKHILDEQEWGHIEEVKKSKKKAIQRDAEQPFLCFILRVIS